LGSREETAKGACYIDGRERRWFLCRGILNAAGFFPGRRPTFAGAPATSGAGIPLTGDQKNPLRPYLACLSKNAGLGTEPPGFRGHQGAIHSSCGKPPGKADSSPAILPPAGQGACCLPGPRLGELFRRRPTRSDSLAASPRRAASNATTVFADSTNPSPPLPSTRLPLKPASLMPAAEDSAHPSYVSGVSPL
jgi:hypothetical protein